MKETDITGKKFNRLTAIRFDHKEKNGCSNWLFKCDCGKEKVIRKSSVINNSIKSCSCLNKYCIDNNKFKCVACNIIKDISEFYERGNRIIFTCKECYKKSSKEYYILNKDKLNIINKRWAKKNPDKAKEIKSKWIKNNPEKRKISVKKWALKNREHIRNNERYRYHNDIKFKLSNCISSLIRGRLKSRLSSKNGKATFYFISYTIDDLIKHLENQFEPWMNWDNYGIGNGKWTIDHIKPDSSFNYKYVEDEEFQKCWALENLRPLEFLENIIKSNKILL